MELLIVVGIVVLLTAISIYTARGMITSNRRAQTLTILTTLDGIRRELSSETSEMPLTMTEYLTRVQAVANIERALRNLPPNRLVSSGGSITAVLDAWQKPVDYVTNTTVGTPSFGKGPYFVSAGPDGQFGTSDDVVSFE